MAIQAAAGIAARALLLPSKKDIAGDLGRGIANGLSMNVSSNMKQFARKLNDMQKKQLPFVMSKTINDTLKAVRRHIVFKVHPKSFDVKQKGFARKAYWTKFSRKNFLTGSVYDQLNLDYLEKQAQGGVKIKRGRYRAIPTRERAKVSGRATYNRVKPDILLQKPKTFVNRTKKTNKLMILQRKTKKQYPLKGHYILYDQNVIIDKIFPFYEEAQKLTRRQFGRRFNVNFKKAMRTARK